MDRTVEVAGDPTYSLGQPARRPGSFAPAIRRTTRQAFTNRWCSYIRGSKHPTRKSSGRFHARARTTVGETSSEYEDDLPGDSQCVNLMTSLAPAHHNAATLYDLSRSITIQGTVREFRLVNPHARVYVTVVDTNGESQEWVAEGANATYCGGAWAGQSMN